MQFFGQEKISKLIKSSDDVITLLAGSKTRVGGRVANLTSTLALNRTVSGFGGIIGTVANSTFYYVYLVHNGTTFGLVASTSSSAPTGYSYYRKVGAFYTGTTGLIFKAYWFGEVNKQELKAVIAQTGVVSEDYDDLINGNAVTTDTSLYTITWNPHFTVIPVLSFAPVSGTTGVGAQIEVSVTTSGAGLRTRNGATKVIGGIWVTAHKNGIDSIQPDWTL